MPIFINKASISSGQVRANTNLPTSQYNDALQAVRYNTDSEVYVNTGTPISTDRNTQGFRFDANGGLFIHPVEAQGVPANISYDGGLPFGLDGKLLVTTASVNRYVIGWPLDVRGFVCMNINLTPPTPPAAPGAFDFAVMFAPPPEAPPPRQVLVQWDLSTDSDEFRIYRDLVLVHTETVAGSDYEWIDTLPGAGTYSYTMTAYGPGGNTPSLGNPRVWIEA